MATVAARSPKVSAEGPREEVGVARYPGAAPVSQAQAGKGWAAVESPAQVLVPESSAVAGRPEAAVRSPAGCRYLARHQEAEAAAPQARTDTATQSMRVVWVSAV